MKKEQDNIFKKYRSRLLREAILKSFLSGAAIGCGVAALVMLISWFVAFKIGFYIALGLLVAVTAVGSVIFYKLKYQPTMKTVAGRVDSLGLEERVLTMTELEGDDSYIAQVQRADTMRALGTVNHTLLKFAITTAMIVAICVTGGLFAGFTTVNGLYLGDIIPSGKELFAKSNTLASFKVLYRVAPGVDGAIYYYTDNWDEAEIFDNDILVYEGQDAPAVVAVEPEGYVFTGWSDGRRDPYRHDINVGGNIDIVAQFERISDEEEDDEPPVDDSLEGSGQGNGNGNGGGTSVDNEDHQRTLESNQTDDGKTFYGEDWESTVSDGMDSLRNNEGLSDETKNGVNDYYNALNPVGGEEGEGGEGEDSGNGN